MRFQSWTVATVFGLGLAAPVAHATNGYFADGFGAKAEGQAGVGIAWAQDALAAATNPAGTANVGDRIDLGVDWFIPRRSASIEGNAFGADATYSGDGTKNFFIPAFGVTWQLNSAWGVGLAVYGNGGLDTDYSANPYGRFGATGSAGVDLEQLFVAPSLAWKPTPEQSVGVAINLAYQRFSAKGIELFSGFSSSPANVSDRGASSSVGAGLKLGWSGNLLPQLTLGVTWASKVRGKFDRYSGLFADGGRFDIPENYGAGLAFRPTANWTLGADVQTIRYSQVAAVGDAISSLLQGTPLGATNGPGFGWRDVTVLKLGAACQSSAGVTWRGGFSHANEPVPTAQTFFNILAPGVIQNHYTAGATWSRPGAPEWTGFVAYGQGHAVQGSGSIPPGNPPGGFGGGNADIRLRETILGVSVAWKL